MIYQEIWIVEIEGNEHVPHDKWYKTYHDANFVAMEMQMRGIKCKAVKSYT